MDAVIVSNLLFQVDSKDNVLQEANRILKPKGRLLIIDWTDSFGGLGPSPEAVFGREEAVNLLDRTGFILEKEIDAGAHHYGIIAIKK